MKKLKPNWITDKLIDFEYKKYVLLGYLKHINKQFNEQKLYPFLSDLIFHYQNLISLKKNKETAVNTFPKKISKIDFKKFVIEYERLMQDNTHMKEIESILDFSIPKIKGFVKNGQELYESFEEKINLFPIGMLSLYKQEGYLLLRDNKQTSTQVYEYKIVLFDNVNEQYRGVRTNYIKTYQTSITYTYETMKRDLVKTYMKFDNPATYVIESDISLPLNETFLPIAKRFLVCYLTSSDK